MVAIMLIICVRADSGAVRRRLRHRGGLLTPTVQDLPFSDGDRVALMVNGVGGTPISELYLLYGQAHKRLAEQGITVGRSYVGEYCTSLDMAGASITLVKLDDEIESLLTDPARISDPGVLGHADKAKRL